MRAFNPAGRRTLPNPLVLGITALLVGCGSTPPAAAPSPSEVAEPTETVSARAQLAALAATAQDRHIAATYALVTEGRPERTIAVTLSPDRSWRFDIPGGALGGTADISIARTAQGRFQCTLPSGHGSVPPACVRVAGPDERIPSAIDPQVQYPFTDWVRVLTDRKAPLSVSVSQPLPDVTGTCFAVESTSASLSAPLGVGIYCYSEDGTLTGARLSFGTLRLIARPGPPPATVALSGPVVTGEPLGLAAPTAPPGQVTPSIIPG